MYQNAILFAQFMLALCVILLGLIHWENRKQYRQIFKEKKKQVEPETRILLGDTVLLLLMVIILIIISLYQWG